MKSGYVTGALALALALAACGEDQNMLARNEKGADANIASSSGQTYSASGTVTALAGDQVTISHGPVEGLGWPAMTMAFRPATADMQQGLRVGDRVTFEFRQADGGYTITSLDKER